MSMCTTKEVVKNAQFFVKTVHCKVTQEQLFQLEKEIMSMYMTKQVVKNHLFL